MQELNIQLLNEHAIEPERHDGVGFDLHASHSAVIPPGRNARVYTGVAWEIPYGYVGLVLQRSGHGLELKLVVVGVIDDTFRGDVSANLFNSRTSGDWVIKRGDRVAQMLILPAPAFMLNVKTKLSQTARGASGFGSTGLSPRTGGNSG